MRLHQRKIIRLKEYDYSQSGEYFVTICTHHHECMLGEIAGEIIRLNEYGNIVEECWRNIPNHFENVTLDAFVVMPNHIHGIIVLNESVGAIHESPLHMTQRQRRIMTIPKIIGRFKMLTAKEINLMKNTPGYPVWQRNYYDRITRNDTELNNIRDYIVHNPLKWLSDHPTRYRII